MSGQMEEQTCGQNSSDWDKTFQATMAKGEKGTCPWGPVHATTKRHKMSTEHEWQLIGYQSVAPGHLQLQGNIKNKLILLSPWKLMSNWILSVNMKWTKPASQTGSVWDVYWVLDCYLTAIWLTADGLSTTPCILSTPHTHMAHSPQTHTG